MQRSINNPRPCHSTYLVILCRRAFRLISFETRQLLREPVPFSFIDLIMMLQREQRRGGLDDLTCCHSNCCVLRNAARCDESSVSYRTLNSVVSALTNRLLSSSLANGNR